jgi:hypothetical protein
MRLALKVGVALIGLILALVLGLRWMFTPESVAAELGITNTAASSTGRADLGGLFLGAGVLCALGLRPGGGRWLWAVALLIGCVALGRALSLALDGYQGQMLGFLGVEVGMVAILVSRLDDRARSPSG